MMQTSSMHTQLGEPLLADEGAVGAVARPSPTHDVGDWAMMLVVPVGSPSRTHDASWCKAQIHHATPGTHHDKDDSADKFEAKLLATKLGAGEGGTESGARARSLSAISVTEADWRELFVRWVEERLRGAGLESEVL